MGGAAAMKILQQFTSGGGGGSQTQLISMAMAEASNLFESSGGAASGNKQDAVNGAAMTVVKLLVQFDFLGSIIFANENLQRSSPSSAVVVSWVAVTRVDLVASWVL